MIVSLEFSGQVIGHQVFEVKVCASPGRDRNTEEAKRIDKKPSKKAPVNMNADNSPPCRLMNTRSMSNVRSMSSPGDAEDSEVFTLQVKGRKNYDILRQVRDAFEAYSAIEKLRKIVSVGSGTGSEVSKRKSSDESGTQAKTTNSSITLEE